MFFFKCISGLGSVSAALFAVTKAGDNSNAIVALVTFAKGMGSINMAGSFANHLDLSPTFAGTLNGMSQTLINFSALAMNEGVAQIVGDKPTRESWHQFLYLSSALNLAGLIFFCTTSSGNAQKWDPSWEGKVKSDKGKFSNINTVQVLSFKGGVPVKTEINPESNQSWSHGWKPIKPANQDPT